MVRAVRDETWRGGASASRDPREVQLGISHLGLSPYRRLGLSEPATRRRWYRDARASGCDRLGTPERSTVRIDPASDLVGVEADEVSPLDERDAAFVYEPADVTDVDAKAIGELGDRQQAGQVRGVRGEHGISVREPGSAARSAKTSFTLDTAPSEPRSRHAARDFFSSPPGFS